MTEKFPNEIVFLRGTRVNLCVIVEEHIPFLLRWLNDEEVNQYLNIFWPMNPVGERKWVEKRDDDYDNLVLAIHTTEGKPIGSMGLHHINWKNRTATTGACIGEVAYHGKGYGREAKQLLLKHAFLTLDFEVIKSEVLAYNDRSYRYNLRCGYQEVGRVPRWHYYRGERHDSIIMAITREDFLKRTKKK